jgi:hypothetical protein
MCKFFLVVMMTRVLIHSLGFRLMFMALPYIFMKLGPSEMIASTVIVVAFLYTWDFSNSFHVFGKEEDELAYYHVV